MLGLLCMVVYIHAYLHILSSKNFVQLFIFFISMYIQYFYTII